MARTCPVCGERFDDSDGNIYCPKCGSIADETVRLSERIQKQASVRDRDPRPVQKEDEEVPKKATPRIDDTNADVKRLSEEGSNHKAAIVVCVLLVLAALAFYFFFMA